MAKKIFNGGVLENLGQKVASVAQSGVEKSKKLAEIARLKAVNITEEDAMKKAYLEIGKLYYAERGAAPDGAYVALCSRISKAKDTIEQNKAAIELLKIREDDEIILDGDIEFTACDLQESDEPEEAPAEEAPTEEAPAEAPAATVEVDPAEAEEE